MAGANFLTSLLMFVTYAIIPAEAADKYWFLIAGALFLIAGIAIIIFVSRLQRKFEHLS